MCFCVLYFFVCVKSFWKKRKNKKVWNCPNDLIYITTFLSLETWEWCTKELFSSAFAEISHFYWHRNNLLRIIGETWFITEKYLLLKLFSKFFKILPHPSLSLVISQKQHTKNDITSFINSWKNLFSEVTFREILVTLSNNVKNYVAQIYRKNADLGRNNISELDNSTILFLQVLASYTILFLHIFK